MQKKLLPYATVAKVNKENNQKLGDLESAYEVILMSESIDGLTEDLVTPSRRFVYKNLMFKLGLQKKKFVFYLFNDCLIYAEYHGTEIKPDDDDQKEPSNHNSGGGIIGKRKKVKDKFINKLPIDSSFHIEEFES